jgi:hypothetical protein
MSRHRRAACRQITPSDPKYSTLHETGAGPRPSTKPGQVHCLRGSLSDRPGSGCHSLALILHLVRCTDSSAGMTAQVHGRVAHVVTNSKGSAVVPWVNRDAAREMNPTGRATHTTADCAERRCSIFIGRSVCHAFGQMAGLQFKPLEAPPRRSAGSPAPRLSLSSRDSWAGRYSGRLCGRCGSSGRRSNAQQLNDRAIQPQRLHVRQHTNPPADAPPTNRSNLVRLSPGALA